MPGVPGSLEGWRGGSGGKEEEEGREEAGEKRGSGGVEREQGACRRGGGEGEMGARREREGGWEEEDASQSNLHLCLAP